MIFGCYCKLLEGASAPSAPPVPTGLHLPFHTEKNDRSNVDANSEMQYGINVLLGMKWTDVIVKILQILFIYVKN